MIPGTWIGSIAWAAAAFYGPETKGTLVPIWSSPEQFGLTRCHTACREARLRVRRSRPIITRGSGDAGIS